MKYVIVLTLVFIFIDILSRVKIPKKDKIRRHIRKATGSKVIKLIAPNHHSKAYKNEDKLIRKARLKISVEYFQLIKISSFLLGCILILLAFVTHHNMRYNEVFQKRTFNINFINYESYDTKKDIFLGKLTKEAVEKIDYVGLIERGEYKELQKQVYNLVASMGLDKVSTVEYAEKTYKNLIYLDSISFKYKTIVFIILLSFSGVLIPKLILIIRAKATEKLMEKELHKLEILTVLLLKKEDMNTYQLLIKLKQKSYVFKSYFHKCINSYQKEGRKAMEIMQKDVDFQPFTDFINILKQGIDTNKRTTATALEMSRRLKNEIYISMVKEKTNKKNMSILVSRFPMLIVGLYLLFLPWILMFKENFY